jgi:CubicO group peptidase (beta-lactamase class C family)
MAEAHLPNVSLAITTRNGIIYKHDFGDINSGIYSIGSMSKSFTALSIMQLTEKGLGNIDDPVINYLPWLYLNDENTTRKVTVRHLLNQTAGIPTRAGIFTPQSEDTKIIEQQFADYLKKVKAADEPGKTHIYSNLNYRLLGLIVQKVSGQSYKNYVQKFILQPLDMTSTFTSYASASKYGFVKNYHYCFGFPVESKVSPYFDHSVSTGYIVSNAVDMCRYLQMMLKSGKTPSNDSIISIKYLEPLLFPVTTKNYGMGWKMKKYADITVWHHSGEVQNFCSAMSFIPQKDFGIIVLSNINSFTEHLQIEDGIIRILLGQPEIAYSNAELYQRYFTGAVVLLILLLFLVNLFLWYKKDFPVCFKGRLFDWVIFIFSILLSIAGVLLLPVMEGITLKALIRYQPDFGYALLIIAVAGSLSSLIKLFIRQYSGKKL